MPKRSDLVSALECGGITQSGCNGVTSKSMLYLLSFFTVGTVIYVMYIPASILDAFARHSVEHYLKTECTYSWCANCTVDAVAWEAKPMTFEEYTVDINIEALCSNSTAAATIPYIHFGNSLSSQST